MPLRNLPRVSRRVQPHRGRRCPARCACLGPALQPGGGVGAGPGPGLTALEVDRGQGCRLGGWPGWGSLCVPKNLPHSCPRLRFPGRWGPCLLCFHKAMKRCARDRHFWCLGTISGPALRPWSPATADTFLCEAGRTRSGVWTGAQVGDPGWLVKGNWGCWVALPGCGPERAGPGGRHMSSVGTTLLSGSLPWTETGGHGSSRGLGRWRETRGRFLSGKCGCGAWRAVPRSRHGEVCT